MKSPRIPSGVIAACSLATACSALSADSNYVTVPFAPRADAMVYQGFPDRNFGGSATMGTRLHRTTARYVYLRFDVSELDAYAGGIAGATLALTTHANGETLQNVHLVNTDSWIEGVKDNTTGGAGEICWTNKPSLGPQIGVLAAAATGLSAACDLTEAVENEQAGDQVISLALGSTVNQYTTFFTREAADDGVRPRLFVTIDFLEEEVRQLIATHLAKPENPHPFVFVDAPMIASTVTRVVQPGQSIQEAIDEISAGGGGTVLLASGTHLITDPLILKSNLVVKGQGAAATFIRNGSGLAFPEKYMLSGSPLGVQNLLIADLTIDGGLERLLPLPEPAYTPETARPAGLAIMDGDGAEHSRIMLAGVTIRHAAQGLHLKGVKNIVLSRCDISGNGGVTFQHNCYLRRVENVLVTDSNFSHSPSGNGFKHTISRNTIIQYSTFNNNARRGIVASDGTNFIVQESDFNGNGAWGMFLTQEEGTTMSWFVLNRCQANTNAFHGIDLRFPARGRILESQAMNNGGGIEGIFDLHIKGHVGAGEAYDVDYGTHRFDCPSHGLE